MSERIIDRSYNKETGELQQFTVIDSTGQPQLIKATPENILLYDPEDELPFEDGLYSVIQGEQALLISEEDPTIMLAPTSNEYCYILRVRDRTVETTPSQSEEALRAIKEAVIDGDHSALVELHDSIVSQQVRRGVINTLKSTFEEEFRITSADRGWLVDDFYLVNWEASLYTRHNDPDEGDYRRGGGGVERTDRSYEFVQLSVDRDITPIEVSINGNTVRLSEREMLFLAKVKWLLNRREQHPDRPFWMFIAKNYTENIDWRTGEYIGDEKQGGTPIDER